MFDKAILKSIPTNILVKELQQREGVNAVIVPPNAEISVKTIGPQ